MMAPSSSSVRFDNENMFICINPKGLDLIEPEHRARIIEACYEYLHRIASEYFNLGIDTGNNARDLTKEKTIEIISEETRASQDRHWTDVCKGYLYINAT